jgi:hypothetical protein
LNSKYFQDYYVELFYYKPYPHGIVFFIGLAFGYIVYKKKFFILKNVSYDLFCRFFFDRERNKFRLILILSIRRLQPLVRWCRLKHLNIGLKGFYTFFICDGLENIHLKFSPIADTQLFSRLYKYYYFTSLRKITFLPNIECHQYF